MRATESLGAVLIREFKVLTILKSGANGFHPLKKRGGAKSFTLSSGGDGGGGVTKREGGVGGK